MRKSVYLKCIPLFILIMTGLCAERGQVLYALTEEVLVTLNTVEALPLKVESGENELQKITSETVMLAGQDSGSVKVEKKAPENKPEQTLPGESMEAELSEEHKTTKLVSGEWVRDHIGYRNIRIIDMRENLRDYMEGHIPGSVYLGPRALRWPAGGVPEKLVPPGVLALLLGQLGVTRDTIVIAYSGRNDVFGTYLIWALDTVGHEKSCLLEGGIEGWLRDGGVLSEDYPAIVPVEYVFEETFESRVRASVEEIKARNESIILVDVRPKQFYEGEKSSFRKAGRIKGAVNRYWADDLKENGSWGSPFNLRKCYRELGILRDRRIVVYSDDGYESAHSYFTLRYILEYPDVANLDGGLSEWVNARDLPLER